MVMETKVIKNREEYEDALRAIERYMDLDPDPGTATADQLELLTLLVRDYESKRFPTAAPDPIDAIRFRMDQRICLNATLFRTSVAKVKFPKFCQKDDR